MIKIFWKIILGILVLATFFSFAVGVAYAKTENVGETIDDLSITRIAPKETFIGQKIWITIVLENKGNKLKEIVLTERLGEADFEKSQAKSIITEYKEELWSYEWKIKLAPQKNTAVSYWLIPQRVGNYVVSPAKVTINNKDLYLKSWSIKVKCQVDGKCDSKIGENYLNCLEDCPTGQTEGTCDFAKDGKCDPDCQKEADPDCQIVKKKRTFNFFWVIGVLVLVTLSIITKAFVLPKLSVKRRIKI